MAHFAEINPATNTVIRVLVVHNDEEHRGQEFLADDLGLGGTWIQVSYNTRAGVHVLGGTPLRYNYPAIGDTYDPTGDGFYAPPPEDINGVVCASWALDGNYIWQPPTSNPGEAHEHYWDENVGDWITPGDPPGPGYTWDPALRVWVE